MPRAPIATARSMDHAELANAGYKREPAAEGKVAARQRAQIDDRAAEGQATDDEPGAGKSRDPGTAPNRIIAEPVPTRSLFENVIQAAKAERHQHHAEVIRAFEQRKVGFVHAYQDGDQTRYQHAGHDINVKQPLP